MYAVLQADGALVANITDTTYQYGSIGFVSAGTGSFDDFTLTTVCDGGTQCVSKYSSIA